MGLVIGSLKWQTSENDDIIIKALNALRNEYGLKDADSQLVGVPDHGYTYFNIELGGINLWWNGGESKAKELFSNVFNKAQMILGAHGVENSESYTHFFPM